MGLFELASWALAVVLLVTVIWPVNVPLLALAYKVRHGGGPLPHETGPFWLRSAFAALGLFAMTWLLVALNTALVDVMGMPAGPIHLMLLLAYLPGAVFYLYWMYAYEDVFEALSLFVVYLLLSGLVLLILGWIFRFWIPLSQWAVSILQPAPL